ncbi:MAG: anthranilate phosphoribosyltransferase [Gammaproteobacteria bacterium]
MDLPAAVDALINKQDIDPDSMRSIMRTIMQGEATQAQIGAFLVGLRMKGESVEEIAAAAEVMRELASGVELSDLPNTVDIVGTGGDSSNSFNISTTSMFVASAAGCHVAKHGNRAVSSKSGSADVLEAAGIRLDLTPEQVKECVEEIGVGFMFAPMHHSAMKHAIGPRKELGVRTVFNLLGPLTNPASAPNQVLGVFSDHWVLPLAEVLQKLGSNHVMVVHSEDGMDEISISAPTKVAELKNGKISEYTIEPEQFGLTREKSLAIAVTNVESSLAMMKSVLVNEQSSALDIVLLNAGSAIYVAGLADDLKSGIEKARETIASGDAEKKLNSLIKKTNQF